ncbi:MAG: hypothetical protein PHV68_09450 [Candidatus Gastranaerophilales bacterium]|nr:hypothetical protein [Candidatus Gastranaerophilales bacterium]
MGQADIRTTMRYAHPIPEIKQQAINVLADFEKNKDVIHLKNKFYEI